MSEVQTQTQTVQPVALTNELIITIEGQDTRIPLESLSLTMNSTEGEILAAVRPAMTERNGIDIADVENDGDYTFTVRKAFNSNTIYVYPKSVAGWLCRKTNKRKVILWIQE